MGSSTKSVSLEDKDWDILFEETKTNSPSDAIKCLLNKIRKK